MRKPSLLFCSALLLAFIAGCFKKPATAKKASLALGESFLSPGAPADLGEVVGWEVSWRPQAKDASTPAASAHSADLETVVIEKVGQQWRFAEPRRPADALEAEANARNFFSLKPFARFEKPELFTPSGNRYAITLRGESAGTGGPQVFIEGQRVRALEAFALRYRDEFFLVKEWFIFALRKRAAQLYPQDFLRLEAKAIRRVQGRDFTVRRTGPLQWWVEPLSASETSLRKVDVFLQTLAFLKAKEAVAAPKEQQKLKHRRLFRLSIAQGRKGGAVEEITLSLYESKTGALYGVRAGDPLLYLLPKAKFSVLDFSLADFKK